MVSAYFKVLKPYQYDALPPRKSDDGKPKAQPGGGNLGELLGLLGGNGGVF